MRRIFGNIISVVLSLLKLSFLKIFHPKGLKFSIIERFSPNVVLEIGKKSSFIVGKKVRVHSGSKLKIRNNASMVIESGVKINYNCIFISKQSIIIREGTEFGPNVLIYDHDHDYKIGLKKSQFNTSPVIIGKNCWIGANTIILRGTEIGDNVVIGAGSIVKGKIESNTVLVQKRENCYVNGE